MHCCPGPTVQYSAPGPQQYSMVSGAPPPPRLCHPQRMSRAPSDRREGLLPERQAWGSLTLPPAPPPPPKHTQI